MAVLPHAEPTPPSAEMAAIAGDYEAVRTSNIRRGPSAETERVGDGDAGATLRVVGLADGRDWYQVETEDGRRGFIYGQLIRPKPEAPPAAEPSPTVEPTRPGSTQVEPSRRRSRGWRRAPSRTATTARSWSRIPAGSFVMGSDAGHWSERPAHRVTIAKPFALGKYEVTVGQWQACIDAGACRSMPTMQGVSASSPVHNVSWSEVQDYLQWLRQATGAALPPADRGGVGVRRARRHQDPLLVGRDGRLRQRRLRGLRRQLGPQDAGRGRRFAANPFGLYDMNGGVMEWVADCWYPDYQACPSDGSARSRRRLQPARAARRLLAQRPDLRHGQQPARATTPACATTPTASASRAT